MDRLLALEEFKRITAPFDGIVTARKTDIGDLINVGSDFGVELFKVADIHKMRIYVRVPQAYAGQLHPGLVADLRLSQFPNETFTARLTTTSNAITKESRTVLVELMADNSDGKLWPGTFAEVHFKLPPEAGVYRVPTSALVFRENGLELATVGPGNKVVMKPITAGRDLGTEIEVRSGLAPTDRVIDSPPEFAVRRRYRQGGGRPTGPHTPRKPPITSLPPETASEACCLDTVCRSLHTTGRRRHRMPPS